MTAVMLIALIVISSLLLSVFAEGITVNESDTSEQTEKNHGNSEGPRLSDRFFRIKNAKNGKYLNFVEGAEGTEAVFTESYVGSASESFRFVHDSENNYFINCAHEDAKYFLSISEKEGNSIDISVEEKEQSLPLSVELTSESEVLISHFTSETNYYIGTEGEDFALLSDENIGEWILEEIPVESLSMAYSETRMKLYSVQRFHAIVSPSSLQPFVNWYADNEEIMLVSVDGTVCALSVGESMLSAKLGSISMQCRIEVCDGDTFAWFSQHNVTSSYWNGGALSGIKFRGRPFASETVWDWMEQGCALTSCAMLFRNMGATYEAGYDFRSGQQGNLPADPYTLALANIGHTGFTSPNTNYKADPVLVRWSSITEAFKVDGKPMKYTQKSYSGLSSIRDALEDHPEGVVVKMVLSGGATHFVLFTKCVNPEASRPSQLKFIISDSMSWDGSDGDNVPFEESASYKAGYRYSSISSLFVWDVVE